MIREHEVAARDANAGNGCLSNDGGETQRKEQSVPWVPGNFHNLGSIEGIGVRRCVGESHYLTMRWIGIGLGTRRGSNDLLEKQIYHAAGRRVGGAKCIPEQGACGSVLVVQEGGRGGTARQAALFVAPGVELQLVQLRMTRDGKHGLKYL